MTKVTWLGEDQTPDLKETTRFGIQFKKDEATEVQNTQYVEKLRTNPNFKVEGEAAEKQETNVPPSQQGAQMPVPKPGEPVEQKPKKA